MRLTDNIWLRSSCIGITALFVLFVPNSPGYSELRFDWTAQEIECASSIGVDLTQPPDPSGATYIRRITWSADAIVVAKVTRVQHDIRGPYPTIVELQLANTLKGGPVASPFYVNLTSGPVFSEATQYMMRREVVGEPGYVKDQHVVLFLTTSYPHTADDVSTYALATNHYRALSKWTVSPQGTATLSVDPFPSRSLSSLKNEVQIARSAQESNCL